MKRKRISIIIIISIIVLLLVTIIFQLNSVLDSNYINQNYSKDVLPDIEKYEANINKIITSTDINTPTIMELLPLKTLSLTPLPTLSDDVRKKIVNEYLTTNGRCDFPCWWGIKVGETDWIQINQKFDALFEKKVTETYDLKINGENYSQNVVTYFYNQDNYNICSVLYEYSGNVIYTYLLTKMTEIYNIPLFVNDLGVPDHIYIVASSYEEGYPKYVQFLPFNLILQYENEGIVIWYEMNAQNDGETITSCFNENNRLHMWIWSNAYGELQIERYALDTAGGGYEGIKKMRVLEDVTDLTTESLVDMFIKNPNACIKTPAKYW